MGAKVIIKGHENEESSLIGNQTEDDLPSPSKLFVNVILRRVRDETKRTFGSEFKKRLSEKRSEYTHIGGSSSPPRSLRLQAY